MHKRVWHCWRVFGTGIGFLIIGLGGVLVFPVLNLLIWPPSKRAVIARHLIRISFRAVLILMRLVGVLRYEITGLKRLDRGGLLILANHPTLIDILFLIGFVKRAECIVKSGLWRNPFTHETVRAAGYICNDDAATVLQQCITSLRSGSNLIIFPEGTRTPADGSIVLRRGAANIAVRGHCNVTPVIIRCTPRMLTKKEQWWQIPASVVSFHIEVKEDILIEPIIAAAENEAVAARRLTQYLQQYFVSYAIA